jgi:hypothetical protein
LLPLGTAEIIASIGPLNDRAVVPLMADLHRHVREGRTLAESVYHVRRAGWPTIRFSRLPPYPCSRWVAGETGRA